MTDSIAVENFASDGALIIGGGRAILLQVANPVVAAGVAKHSDFRQRPIERLRSTLTFAYATVIGTPDQAAIVAQRVNRAHVPVAGAVDPHHQLWVAATLYDSAVTVHDKLFGPLEPEAADAVYAAYAPLGTALQVPPELWPADRAAFAEYWIRSRAGLRIGHEAREIARDLFRTTTGPTWLRSSLPLAALLTASLLTPVEREKFGFAWSPLLERRAEKYWRALRIVANATPRSIRSLPSRRLLASLKFAS